VGAVASAPLTLASLVHMGGTFGNTEPIRGNAKITDPGRIKFDSGASRCMSGQANRLERSQPVVGPIRITGFNGQRSMPTYCVRMHTAAMAARYYLGIVA